MKTGNRIPRQFNKMVCEMLIETNMDKVGDTLHVYKNDNGYLALNTRTQKYAYMFASMLRNESVLKVKEII